MTLIGAGIRLCKVQFKSLKKATGILVLLTKNGLGLKVEEICCADMQFNNTKEYHSLSVLDKHSMAIVLIYELVLSRTLKHIDL